jgi:hypothetical protein
MKKIRTITALLAAMLAVVIIVGCTTTSTGTKALDPVKVSQLAPALQTTVAGAVVYAYTKDHNAIKYIAVLQTALNEFVLSTNLNPSVLQAKVYALPVKELKTPEAQLIITPVLAAYKAFGEQYVTAGLADQVGWRMLVKAISDGIESGLAGVKQIESQ